MVAPGNQKLDLLVSDHNLPASPQSSEATGGIENPYFSAVFANMLGAGQPSQSTQDVVNEGIPQQNNCETTFAQLAKTPASGKQLSDVFNNQALQVKPGTYEVLDSSVQGEIVRFTVAKSNGNANPFTISIPLSQLKNGVELNMLPVVNQNLVNQDVSASETARLEQYLTDVNLKEIEIIAPERLTKTELPEQVAIIAEGSKQLILQTKRSRRLNMGKGNGNNAGNLNVGDSEVSNNGQESVISRPQALFKVALSAGKQYCFHDDFIFENQGTSGNLNKSIIGAEDTETFTVFSKLTPDVDTGNHRLSVQPVRFTLPSNIASVLKPNGQGVMLRIEPEHLGPARLSLIMSGDKLRARIVVVDVQAKVAVEKSLDHLIEQLSKADIEVDHIEVTTAGKNSREELFERRPLWHHRPNRTENISLNNALSFQQQADSRVMTNRSEWYVGVDGVNLLA